MAFSPVLGDESDLYLWISEIDFTYTIWYIITIRRNYVGNGVYVQYTPIPT